MQRRGREVRHLDVVRAHQQLDLRAARDDARGPALDEAIDDPQVGRARVGQDDTLHELVVDDVVDEGAVGLVGHDDAEAVALEPGAVEVLLHGVARAQQRDPRHAGLDHGPVGQAEGEARFIKEVTGLYLIAFFVMYAMLAVAFHSYWQPILILVAMPYAFIGAIYGHAFLSMTMAIFSYFGIAAAAGVVVNDNLVLIDYTNRLREKGMKPLEAIVEAGVVRFRPIMLTTATTIIGLTPMMMERSIQAKFLIPIVVSLVFGVFTAFFVTLLMVPALYAIGVDMADFRRRSGEKIKGLFRRRGGHQESPTTDRVG